jgi:hypothetical protein
MALGSILALKSMAASVFSMGPRPPQKSKIKKFDYKIQF